MSTLLEVCVGSLEDALAAADAGADRLEICGATELGGLTPSMGLVERVIAEVAVPTVVMVRPRAAGFAYSVADLRVMRLDTERILAVGAAGIVFGLLDDEGRIDEPHVREFVELADGAETVFHRAFDSVADNPAALETLIACGVTRVLTTGGPPTAAEGAPRLKQLIDAAGDRIQILPGGGVAPAGVTELVTATGCQQVHIGASTGKIDPSIPLSTSRGLNDLRRIDAGEFRAVDPTIVAAVRAALDGE